MLFDDLAEASDRLAATASRRAKVDTVAAVLRATAPGDLAATLPILSGRLRQRRTGLGHAAAARGAPEPSPTATLTLADVDVAFQSAASASGAGSAGTRRRVWEGLLRRATAREQRLLTGLVTGDVRQGAAEGVLVEALAAASGAPSAAVRQAITLAGDPVTVGAALLARGPQALDDFALALGTPLSPMLAQSAPDVAAALARTGPALVEWKLDGFRVQAHGRAGVPARLFSRSLDDITPRLPTVAAAVSALGLDCVLDGEVLLVDPTGRPRPFQETSSRVARRDGTTDPGATPSYAVFDLLHLQGRPLADRPLSQRRSLLADLVATPPQAGGWPPLVLTPALAAERGAEDSAAAAAFAAGAVAAGHEGVVAKGLATPYAAGRRGAAWVKVKPVATLDLVVLAAEWGSGRRQGWLSNLHLGARDPAGEHGPAGGFVMLGKTFKGLTDAMLAWQTAHLQGLRTGGTRWRVDVAPELVVEIALDGIQTSPRYPAGMALRFARVVRHRPDKAADDADSLDSVRTLHRTT
ncbi:MAG: ATP-dependent DNA ligase [Kineosporiaceae bacterium]